MTTSKLSAEDLADLRQTFSHYDRDHNGSIDAKELSGLLQALGMDMELSELKIAMQALDEDGSGVIEFDEFVDWWAGQ